HGTGTPLGDPVEIDALTRAFRTGTRKRNFCAVGSVKTNLGHLDTAAGVAGLIKTVMALKHGRIPPSLHFDTPNPAIDFHRTPFYVNTRLVPWQADHPRRAGVSSFGIGGTNAHVVLEEPPRPHTGANASSIPDSVLFCLSARTEAALERYRNRLADHLSTLSKAEMADTAYTLNRGRKPFSCRGFFIGSSPAESADVLRTPDAPDFKHRTGCADSPVIFMFPGQGARTRNWGQMLYDGEPIFRSALDNCARHLAKTLACNITEILYGSTANRAKLKETRFAQPALFATEYALACLYMDRSITPAAMIGHSLGEYVAATLAGVFSLEDALDLVALRGRLMQALPAGAMLSAGLSHADFPKALGTDLSKTELSNEELSVAAVNARNTCVISGPVPSIERAERKLLARNIQCRRLDTAHAFHSAMMAPMLEAFNNHLSRVNMNPPRRPYVSNLTGTWVTRAPDPADWCRHLRETVRFADGLDTLLEAHPGAVLVELGPGRALTGAARQHRGVMTVTALPEDVRAASLLNAFGQLWLAGATIQWHKFYQGESRRRRPVPTYPFEKERYWMEPPTASLSGENGANPCQSRSQRPPDTSTASNGFPLPDQRFYVPVWQREIAPETTGNAGDTDKLAWLIFADPFGLGDRLAASLEQTNARVVTVTQKNHFTRSGERSYTLDSGQEGHYNELFSHLSETGCLPDTIVHLWGVDPTLPAQPSRHLTQGFYSLVYTARALWRQSPQKKCRIHVITDQVQAVTGTEVLSPEKSAVLGPVRVIPQEYPNITCRCIDIEISRTDAQSPATGLRHQDPGIRDVANRLLGQIMDCAPPLPVSAIRGPFLWHQTFAETPVPDTAAPDTGLRREGVYLITGGLGGMGMVIARYLAQRVRARLALVSRTPFPPRHQWHEILRSGVCRHLDTGTRQRVVEEMTDRLILETDLDTQIGYPDVTRDMDTLCTVYIRAYLAGGIDTSPGRCYDRSHLISTLGLEPRFEKFFDAMLATLEEDGIIRRTEDQVEFLTTPPLDDIDALCSRIADAHPGMAGDLDLLAHCVSHYPATLSGQTPAIEVLYPNGQTSLLARAANSPGAVSDRFCIRLVREILAAVTAAGPDKKLKILEVGGGNGGLTRSLKGVLDRHNAEYHFTDLGNYFVVNARRDARAAGDGDWMHFDVLDISKAPGPQGYSHGTFDIILGFNVVHAVPRVRTALGHLKSLLAPRGMLCLVETVTQHRWTDMVWGLTEGWWSFEDHEIRQGSPLLSTGQWEEVLRQEGFENIRSYSGTTDGGADPETALILARTPEVPDSPPVNTLEEARNQSGEKLLPRDIPGKARWLLEMENLGSRVMVINADAGDPEAMAKVHQKITDDFGRVHGIIHAAGIEGGGAIQVDAPSTAALEFTAKITGTRVIEKVFGPDNPDFFMLCSSHNSLLGGPGQVGYAAANAFLDTYAHARSRDGGPLTVSVNWDRWQGVGMAAKVEATHLARTSRPLTGGLTASEGTDAFHRILAGRRMPQVVVSKTDFEAQLQHRPDDTARRKGPQAGQPNAPETKEGHCRPNLTTPYLAPRYALEKTMAELWQEVLGMASVGIHDDFHELGGDSLMATRVVSRLREAMDVDLTVRDLLERPTIADLAAHLTATLVAPAPDETTDGYCEEEEL
ncbi:MAG TPA: hypothetical protein DHV36_25235, partial [Desulfobacteraceae bacterium]|nr:hypothetical protein [Desulfobacteraceae bacterium]